MLATLPRELRSLLIRSEREEGRLDALKDPASFFFDPLFISSSHTNGQLACYLCEVVDFFYANDQPLSEKDYVEIWYRLWFSVGASRLKYLQHNICLTERLSFFGKVLYHYSLHPTAFQKFELDQVNKYLRFMNLPTLANFNEARQLLRGNHSLIVYNGITEAMKRWRK